MFTFLDALKYWSLAKDGQKSNISENSSGLLDLLTFALGSSYVHMYLFGLLEFYLF